MATKGGAANRYYQRTTNLPTFAAHTMMGWFRIDTNRECGIMEMQGTGSNKYLTGIGATGLLQYWNGSTGGNGSTLSTGVWYHITQRVLGISVGGYECYLNGILNFTASGNGAGTAGTIWLANDDASSVEWFNGAVAGWKVWDATLSANEILIESKQLWPVRYANLNSFHPLFSTADDEVDYSTHGRTLTVNGTFSNESGPSCRLRRGMARHSSVVVSGGSTVQTKTLTSGARLKFITALNLTSGARLKFAPVTVNLVSGARLRTVPTVALTSGARLKFSPITNLVSGTRLKYVASVALTSGARLRYVASGSLTSGARLRFTPTAVLTSGTRLKFSPTAALASGVRLKYLASLTLPSGANLLVGGVGTKTLVSGARLRFTPTAALTSGAQLRYTGIKTTISGTRLRFLATLALTSGANLTSEGTGTKSLLSGARLKFGVTQTLTSGARLKLITTPKTLTSGTRLRYTPELARPSGTRLRYIPTTAQPSGARIRFVPSLARVSGAQLKFTPTVGRVSGTRLRYTGSIGLTSGVRLFGEIVSIKPWTFSSRLTRTHTFSGRLTRTHTFDSVIRD